MRNPEILQRLRAERRRQHVDDIPTKPTILVTASGYSLCYDSAACFTVETKAPSADTQPAKPMRECIFLFLQSFKYRTCLTSYWCDALYIDAKYQKPLT